MDYVYQTLAYESYVKYLKNEWNDRYGDISTLIEHFDEDLQDYDHDKIKILERGMEIAGYL